MMAEKRFDQVLIWLFICGSLIAVFMNFTALKHNTKLSHQYALKVPLQQARQYLLQYAQLQDQLPCADGNGDGISDVIQSTTLSNGIKIEANHDLHCQYRLGWLPEQTLHQPGLRDEDGQRFLYAVAESDNQLLSINGQEIALAILLSAGPAMKQQTSRRPPITNQQNFPLRPALYLEGLNAQQPWQQFSSLGSIDSNDRLTWITLSDWQTRS